MMPGRAGGTDDGSEGIVFGGSGASDCCGITPGGAGAVGADDEAAGQPCSGNTECAGVADCTG